MTSPQAAKGRGSKKVSPPFSPTNKTWLSKSNRKYYFRMRRSTPPSPAIRAMEARRKDCQEEVGLMYSPMWRTWRGVRCENLLGRAVKSIKRTPTRSIAKPKRRWAAAWCARARSNPATPAGSATNTPEREPTPVEAAVGTPEGAPTPPSPTQAERSLPRDPTNNNESTPIRTVEEPKWRELFPRTESKAGSERSPSLGVHPLYSPITPGSFRLESEMSDQWRPLSTATTASVESRSESSADSPKESYQGIGSPPLSPVVETLGSSPMSVMVLEDNSRETSPFVPRVESMSATLLSSSEEEREKDRAWKRSFFESTRRMIKEYQAKRKREFCPRAVEELQRAYQVVAGVHRESVYMDHQDKTPKLSEFLDKLEEMIKEVKAEMQEDRRQEEELKECNRVLSSMDKEDKEKEDGGVPRRDSPDLD